MDELDGRPAALPRDLAAALAREAERLSRVTDRATLDAWRREVVAEVMVPLSAPAAVLGRRGDPGVRAEFLDRWRDHIAAAITRVVRAEVAPGYSGSTAGGAGVDADGVAVMILAALHGGSLLTRVSGDARPIDAALDLALAALACGGRAAREPQAAVTSMDP